MFRCAPEDDISVLDRLSLRYTVTQTPDGPQIRLTCAAFDEAISTTRAIREIARIQTFDLRIESMTLEDVFLKLTGKPLEA